MEKLRSALIIVSIVLIASLLYAWHLYDQAQALNNALNQTNNNIQAANSDINNMSLLLQGFGPLGSDAPQYNDADITLILSEFNILNSELNKISQDLVSTDTASSSTQN